jgi:Tfp pilus assembly protein PilP
MKLTFNLTTGILAMAMVVGGSAAKAAAQKADAIDNARSTAKSLQQNPASPAPKAATSTAATKPAPGAPAPAVKPAAIPGSKPVAKPVASAKPAAEASSHNHLQKVNVVPGANGFQIEISSSQAITPSVTKLDSPSRLLVELPDTTVATAQNKIPVGSGGVKGVRIGMDGKTPPTTSVVVDLDKPLAYELTPGPAGKVILTLHSDGAATVAKSAPAPAAKTSAVAKASAPAAKAAAAPSKVAVEKAPAAKPTLIPANSAVAKASAAKPASPVSKSEPKQQAKAAPATKIAAPPAPAPTPTKAAAATPAKPKPEEKKWAMSGKRDPFFSPVVQTNGSGCSTGKKCLEVGSINLRGVVKSDSGFIAVVTNNLNKAYFLRENDPVFNGYVVKITGDSVVFQETIQDKLGKPFTREIVKRIFTPAV